MPELIFEFESKSIQGGKALIDIEDLWKINAVLPVGEWHFKIEYIHFYGSLQTESKKIIIESPQIQSENKKPSLLGIINKEGTENFFCFSSNEKSRRISRIITKKTSKIELEIYKLPSEGERILFESDFTVKVSISIPYG